MITLSTNSGDDDDYRPGKQRQPSWIERPVSPVSFVERPRPAVATYGNQRPAPGVGLGIGGQVDQEDAPYPTVFKSVWSETQSDVSGSRSAFGSDQKTETDRNRERQ